MPFPGFSSRKKSVRAHTLFVEEGPGKGSYAQQIFTCLYYLSHFKEILWKIFRAVQALKQWPEAWDCEGLGALTA